MAPDDSTTLTPETVGLSPVQQGVHYCLPVPLDGVVETVPRAVILHRGVAPRADQSTSNILVARKQVLLERFQ